MIRQNIVSPPLRGRAQEGLSHAELEQAARDHGDHLLGMARRTLHSREDAADAVQEAFCAALSARHSYQGRASVMTWLYQITRNCCLMKLRSRTRTREVPLEGLSARHGRVDCDDAWECDRTRRHLERLDREEAYRALHAGLRRLPPDQRRMLELRYQDQLTTREMASRLGISENAVRTRLCRIRQTLQETLQSPAAS
jgi:RNA polymerase sigma-70 factor (ECF subfamily)